MGRRQLFYLFIFLVLLSLHLAPFVPIDDDAYIHLRIVRNFIDHGLPYFNADEPVLATSSIGWILVLSVLQLVFGPSLQVLMVLNSLISLAVIFLCSQLLIRLRGQSSIRWCDMASTALCIPVLYQSSVGLMETPLALGLALLGIGRILGDKPGGLALLGISVFFRLELIVLFAGIFCFRFVTSRTGLTRELVLTALVAAPFLLFLYLFFGVLIPQPVSAKQLVYQISYDDVYRAVVGKAFGARPSPRLSRVMQWWGLLLFVGCSAMLTLKTAFAARREILLAYAIAISGGLILTAYFVKGVMLHDWYHPLYLLPIYLGLLMLDRCASNSGARSVFCEVSLIYLLAIPWLGLTNQVNQSVHGYDDWQRRVQLYRIVGRELSTILPNGKLLTGEIGALGYEYRGQILDAIGLASPVAVKYHPLKVPEERSSPGFGAIPVGYVNEVNPDVVVGFNFQVEGFRRSKTIENYRTFTCVDQTGSVTADAILGTLWIFINQNTGIVTLPPEICGAGYQF